MKKISIFLIPFFFLKCVAFNTIRAFDFAGEKSLELVEQRIESHGTDKILVISVEGEISDSPKSGGGLFSMGSHDSMVAVIKEELKKAKNDSQIKGVILKIDSPGGGVTASDIIYHELMEFKEQKKIPVVALFMDVAASGGYYVAMASDGIVSHPTAITGSIGVIISGINVKDGLEKIGIKDQSITSGANKSILSPLREFTPEQRKIIQSVVDQMYERFFKIVKKNRSKVADARLRLIADGRIFTAEQALQEGLVDRVGYLQDAVDHLKKMSNYTGSDSPSIIHYGYDKRQNRNFYHNSYAEPGNDMISSLLKLNSQRKFMYLWKL